ncbi:MAG TPA: hypothetical protein VLL97_13085 [Acidobacteriota bacterium]|nr:hypothetical protein [Acidobacteriota bacterium]
MSDASAAGAPERLMMKKRLLEEKQRIAREKKSAKMAEKAQAKNEKIEAVGNVYTLDQMTGKTLSNATGGYGTDILKAGANKLIDVTGARPMMNAGIGAVKSAVGSIAPNLVGMNTAPQAISAAQGLTSLGSNLGSTAVGQLAAPVGATVGATGAIGQAANSIGSLASTVATPVGYVAAANAARNIWGGDLNRSYADKGWSQKIAAAPVSANMPGFSGLGTANETQMLGKDNPVSKVYNALGSLEEKTIGKPLDKIFGEVGNFVSKIFCFAAGTPMLMADGETTDVELIMLHEEMMEGGKVYGTGVVLNDDVYDYQGVGVSGSHAVMEKGKWIRVRDSSLAYKIALTAPMEVYPIVNENHICIVNGIVFSDYAETDHGTGVNDAFRLEYMNTETDKIKYLSEKYNMRKAA